MENNQQRRKAPAKAFGEAQIRGQTEMESKTNLVGKMVILKYTYILNIYLDDIFSSCIEKENE